MFELYCANSILGPGRIEFDKKNIADSVFTIHFISSIFIFSIFRMKSSSIMTTSTSCLFDFRFLFEICRISRLYVLKLLRQSYNENLNSRNHKERQKDFVIFDSFFLDPGDESQQLSEISTITWNNGSQLKNPDISGALYTLRILYSYTQTHCEDGARNVRVL